MNLYTVRHAVKVVKKAAIVVAPYVVKTATLITMVAQFKDMQKTEARNQYVDYKMKQENYHHNSHKRP